MIALLKAVALGWREARLAEDARKVHDEGERLYKVLGTLSGYVSDLGKALSRSVSHYNKALGSRETTLFLRARRLRDPEVSSAPIDTPAPIDEALRDFSRADLLTEAAPVSLPPCKHE